MWLIWQFKARVLNSSHHPSIQQLKSRQIHHWLYPRRRSDFVACESINAYQNIVCHLFLAPPARPPTRFKSLGDGMDTFSSCFTLWTRQECSWWRGSINYAAAAVADDGLRPPSDTEGRNTLPQQQQQPQEVLNEDIECICYYCMRCQVGGADISRQLKRNENAPIWFWAQGNREMWQIKWQLFVTPKRIWLGRNLEDKSRKNKLALFDRVAFCF